MHHLPYVALSMAFFAFGAASADAASLNNNFYNVIAPTFSGPDGNLSHVRLANDGAATTTFVITVVGTPSGQIYGTGQIQIPAHASIQFELPYILATANAGPLANGDTSYALYMQDPDSALSYQHVVYNGGTGFFENVSDCHYAATADYAALNTELTNVHTSRLSTLPSEIHIHNYATTSAVYDVSVVDSNTGTTIGVVPLTLAPNTSVTKLFSWFEQQLSWTPTNSQHHANVAFAPRSPATFQIELSHYVHNASTSAFTNLTQRCGFVSSSAAQTAFAGTVAGPESQSGTLSVKVQGSVAAASPAMAKAQSASEKPASLSSASATLRLSGAASVTATGTYDAAANTIALAGNGYAFTGTVNNGIYAGSYTGPNGVTGAFSSVAGTHESVTAYCGTYDEPRPPGEATARAGGVFNLQIAVNGTISGDTSSTYGSGYHYGLFSGHAEGSLAYVTHSSANGDPANTDNVIGYIQNGTISGTYPAAGGEGKFTGSVCAVPAS